MLLADADVLSASAFSSL